MDDLISRQAAIDAFNTNLNELVVGGEENAKTVENYLNRVLDKIKCLPSAQPDLLDDGTLMMTVPQGMLGDVKRVLVDEVGTKNCKVMYQDEPERKRGEWIIDKDCEGKSRYVTCNRCGHKEFNWNNPNYCENCGAEMEGEDK